MPSSTVVKTEPSLLSPSPSSSSSSSSVTPPFVFLTIRSDKQQEFQYRRKADSNFVKVFDDFSTKFGRPFDYFYLGQQVKPHQSPRELKMGEKVQMEARAPIGKKRQFSLTHASGSAAAATATVAASSHRSESRATAVESKEAEPAPMFKRAKSENSADVKSAAAAAAASPSPSPAAAVPPVRVAPPFRPVWNELLLGSLTFILGQQVNISARDGNKPERPSNVYTSLSVFAHDCRKNRWDSTFLPIEDENPFVLCGLALQREHHQRVLAALLAWSTRPAMIRCHLKILETEERGKCAPDCKCLSRTLCHTVHVSVSLLPGAHNEPLPYANYIFALINPQLKQAIDELTPDPLYQVDQRMELGDSLELAVRTKYDANQARPSSFTMEEDDYSNEHSSPAVVVSSRRGRPRNTGADSYSASSSSSSSYSTAPVTEQARIRDEWGLPPDESVNEFPSHPLAQQLMSLSLPELSKRANLNLTLRDYQAQSILWALQQEVAASSISDPYWKKITLSGREAYYSPFFQTIRFQPLPNIYGGMIAEEMGLGQN